MARTELSAQETDSVAGLAVVFEDANVDGNSVRNNGHRIVIVQNADTASHTVTQVTGGQASGVDVADPQVVVAAGAVAVVGPWPRVFEQSGTHEVWLNYDAVTSVTVAAIEIE